MELQTREYKRVTVIRVVGRVDASVAPKFEEALRQAVEGSHAYLVLEMDSTDYISSAGVRAMISAQKALKAKGGAVLLAQPSDRVKEVLDIAGLDSLFQVYPSTEVAVGSI
ncbi:MAG: STAS domain-containing protein [Anaerolineales bacterium]|nr:STAS domain-containing protein [Anaerolineales bacterium]